MNIQVGSIRACIISRGLTQLIIVVSVAVALSFAPLIVQAADRNQEMRKFAKFMQTNHKLDAQEVMQHLSNAKFQAQVLRIMQNTPEQKVSWLDYKERFINTQHIRNGKKFIERNQDVLHRAYQEYGVPPEIITAIIGVETNYGQLYGTFRTLDVLTTIAFSDFRRAEFFRQELEEFLLLASEQQNNPFDYISSYAGAMGYGQFLPSSYRNYGVNFDEEGQVDLTNSIVDAIGSIGNYLQAFGWERDVPVMLAAQYKEDRVDRSASKTNGIKFNSSLKPHTNIRRTAIRYGLIPASSLTKQSWRPTDKVTLLKFAGEEPELWMGLNNYYVLSRYNPSHKYVMALYLLSRAVAS